MGSRTRANISDFSVGLNTEDVFVLPPTFGRNYLALQNVGPGTAAVSFNGNAAAINANGSIMLAANAKPLIFQKNVPQNAIHAISGTTASLLVQSDDQTPTGTPPFWILNPGNPPAFDLDFMRGRYWVNNTLQTTPSTFLNCSRITTGATDLLPSSSSGAAFNTYGANTLRFNTFRGLIVEEARLNNLLNSTAPVTQTTASLGIGTYTLWVNGSGSATASVGTATAAALPLVSTQGVPQTFAITVAGTIVVTVAGSLNAFQLELGDFGTSLISTAGATATRNADVVTISPAFFPTFGAGLTIYGQGNPFAPTAESVQQFLLTVSDGTNNNRAQLRRINAGGAASMLSTNNGASVSTGATAWPQATSAKLAASLSSVLQSSSFNGGTAATAAQTWPPTAAMTAVNIGGGAVLGAAWYGLVERVAIWPTVALSAAALQSITT